MSTDIDKEVPKLIDVARKYFEDVVYKDHILDKDEGDYVDDDVMLDWLSFLRGFSAGWKSPQPDQYEDEDGSVVWNLDMSLWESIKQAAKESTWIPKEYYANDWVADVNRMLRNGVDR